MLTLASLEQTWKELQNHLLPPLELRVNPLTMVGKYAGEWKKIEDATWHEVLGRKTQIIPVKEDKYTPEGIVVKYNPKLLVDSEMMIIDLRREQDA